MELEGMGVFLLLVELFAETGWEHFVDSEISEEEIVVIQELLLVFELLVFFLELGEADDLSNAWDLEVFDFSLELTCWVLHEHTCSCMVLCIIEWVGNFNLDWLGGRVQRHFVQSEAHLDQVFLLFKQLLGEAGCLCFLRVFFESFHSFDDLLSLQCLLQLGVDLLSGFGEELGMELLLLNGGTV
jgi:hypothetical protein